MVIISLYMNVLLSELSNNKTEDEAINSECKIDKSKTVVKLTFPVRLKNDCFLLKFSHKDCKELPFDIKYVNDHS